MYVYIHIHTHIQICIFFTEARVRERQRPEGRPARGSCSSLMLCSSVRRLRRRGSSVFDYVIVYYSVLYYSMLYCIISCYSIWYYVRVSRADKPALRRQLCWRQRSAKQWKDCRGTFAAPSERGTDGKIISWLRQCRRSLEMVLALRWEIGVRHFGRNPSNSSDFLPTWSAWPEACDWGLKPVALLGPGDWRPGLGAWSPGPLWLNICIALITESRTLESVDICEVSSMLQYLHDFGSRMSNASICLHPSPAWRFGRRELDLNNP